MANTAHSGSITSQLRWMAMLVLLAALTVLAFDEWGIFEGQAGDRAIRGALVPVNLSSRILETYLLDPADVVEHLNEHTLDWPEAMVRFNAIRSSLDQDWQRLTQAALTDAQRATIAQAVMHRVAADATLDAFAAHLQAHDTAGLADFLSHQLHPGIAPLAGDLRLLSTTQMSSTSTLIDDEIDFRSLRRYLRWILFAAIGVLLWHMGRQLLREFERGCNTLIEMARAIEFRNWGFLPKQLPAGELGAVAEGVRRIQNAILAEQARGAALNVQLQRMSAQFQAILDHAPIGIWARDGEGRYLFASSGFRTLFRIGTRNIIGERDELFFPAADAARYRASDQAVLRDHRIEQFSETIEFGPNDSQTVLTVKFPIFDEHGVAYAAAGVCVDIGEQTRLQQALVQRNKNLSQRERQLLRISRSAAIDEGNLPESFRTIVSAACAGLQVRRTSIWLLDETHTSLVSQLLLDEVDGFSDAPTTLLRAQYPAYFTELDTGRAMMAHSAMTDPRTCEFAESYLSQLGITSMLDVSIRQHGKLIGVLCCEHIGLERTWTDEESFFASALADLAGRAMNAAARTQAEQSLRELNATLESRVASRTQELARARGEAEDANHAKSSFLAAMSHEIRTPMIGLTGMLEVLEHTPLDDEQQQMIRVVQQSSATLLQIIGDILDFSKIEAHKLDIAPVDASLSAIVDSVTHAFASAASQKGVLLNYHIAPDVATAHRFDPVRVRQILSNFLSNAVKFTDHGRVDLTITNVGEAAGGQQLEITVADTGIGISEAQQQRLFQPFSQAETSTTRRYGGSGLGLVICRRLAALMDGEIRMQSRYGVGTTMTLALTLPLGDPARVGMNPEWSDERRTRTIIPTRAQALAEGSLILLAEDHPTNRHVLIKQLALAGYRAEAAEDGDQALDMLAEGGYALLLTDVHMPNKDGYALAQCLRAREAANGQARLPIIALTANVLQGEPERCLAVGMDDYLAKPATIAALLTKLRKWLPHVDPFGAAALTETSAADDLRDTGPWVDPAVLLSLSDGDPDTARDLLAQFSAACAADIIALKAAADARDLSAIARQAHRINGAARTMGATLLIQRSEPVEASARAGRLDEAIALIPALDAACRRTGAGIADVIA
jgi:signal transduction histidine kinase/HPt (histidine-containing phosphotransfer) domain-containing protein/PAS domain-containing protein/FixJ family two-component response regulator